tara:strand:- start:1223 stop:1567 length:345 start_codon:yes stop_codon:yes gene_type:complete
MNITIYITLGIIIYLFIGGISRHIFMVWGNYGSEDSTLFGIFWIVVIPILLPSFFFKKREETRVKRLAHERDSAVQKLQMWKHSRFKITTQAEYIEAQEACDKWGKNLRVGERS